jgi:hypothetical protein
VIYIKSSRQCSDELIGLVLRVHDETVYKVRSDQSRQRNGERKSSKFNQKFVILQDGYGEELVPFADPRGCATETSLAKRSGRRQMRLVGTAQKVFFQLTCARIPNSTDGEGSEVRNAHVSRPPRNRSWHNGLVRTSECLTSWVSSDKTSR